MLLKLQFYVFIIGLLSCSAFGQDITLFQQFNGKYDFTFIGNTLNPEEDSYMVTPVINTTSAATLALNPNDHIEKAYLYWAGCGPGDFEVTLNNTVIVPDRTFQHHRFAGGLDLDYFSNFTDITTQVQTTGNGLYTLADLDLNPWIDFYFQNRTNFGGWAIIIIYSNPNLPQNQLNVYDGLQAVPDQINITLNSLNVIDNLNSKIGFLAWEGDENIAVSELLSINGNTIGNPPLNPINNAFNGTNSFTNSDQLHNMDLDVYDLQNNIHVGDTTAEIQLQSGQDFVMINAIVTKLNSQVPDAQVTVDNVRVPCNSRVISVDYTVYNPNSTAILHAGVPIAIYINDVFIQILYTQGPIAINGSESGIANLVVPDDVASPFDIKFVVDDDGSGHGTVVEVDENNNTDIENVSLSTSEPIGTLNDVFSCNEGLGMGTFDFLAYENTIRQNPTDIVSFYPTLTDLQNGTNAITDPSNYSATTTPATIFVKVDNGNCYNTTTFLLKTRTCPPTVYNYISINDDPINNVFFIDGLRDIFLKFKLSVYNRWGKLVWTGNNQTPDWDGYANKGTVLDHSTVPEGTYYYVLELNDKDYPQPLVGYLYLTR